MRREKIWGALSFLAVIGLLVGHVAIVGIASGEEQQRGPVIHPDGVYLVRDGDTLWAIAGRYLDNPRLWPRIWSQNPFVSDPHRIFPGDPLVIPGLTPPPSSVAEIPPLPEERVVAPAAPAPEAAPPPGPEEEVGAPAAPTPEEEAAQMVEFKEPEEVVIRPVTALSSLIPRPALECSGFVAEGREIRHVGRIIRPVEEHERFWYGDHIFVDLGGRRVERGDRFQVIRPTVTVRHPTTARPVGIKVRTLGTVEIVSTAGPAPRARIMYSCEDITLGDFLVEAKIWAAPPRGLSHSTGLRVGGYIVGSKDDAHSLGMGDIVYVDVGRAKEVVPGDEFGIYRPSGIAVHPGTGRVIPLAPVKQGELVVIRTSAGSAAALLTRSGLDLHVGERIVLIRKMP